MRNSYIILALQADVNSFCKVFCIYSRFFLSAFFRRITHGFLPCFRFSGHIKTALQADAHRAVPCFISEEGEVSHGNDTYFVAVFLTEQSHRAGFLRFLSIHDVGYNRDLLLNLFIYQILNFFQFFRCCLA